MTTQVTILTMNPKDFADIENYIHVLYTKHLSTLSINLWLFCFTLFYTIQRQYKIYKFEEIKIERNFLETSHGKNVFDGLGYN